MRADQAFRHRALHYGSDQQFVQESDSFLHQATTSGEAVLVAGTRIRLSFNGSA